MKTKQNVHARASFLWQGGAFAFAAALAGAMTACGGIVSPVDANGDGGSTGSSSTSTGSGTSGSGSNSSKMSAVGGACTSAVDCVNSDGTDGGLGCAASHENIPFQGGDCTAYCQQTSDCPGAAGTVICGSSAYDLGASASCMLACDPNGSDCRAGFTCLAVTLPDNTMGNGCWSRPTH